MPTAKPNKNAVVWVRNHVRTDGHGNIHAGNAVLYRQDRAGNRLVAVTHTVTPGLCDVPKDLWDHHAGSRKSIKIGPRRLELVDLDKMDAAELREAVEETASVAMIKQLAESGGPAAGLAADLRANWGDPERSHKRAVIETLANQAA